MHSLTDMIEVETVGPILIGPICILELVPLVEIRMPREHAFSDVPREFFHFVNFAPDACSDGTV